MFEKFNFTSRQIDNYYKAASRNFRIARDSAIPEVTFTFSYESLIKLAIAVCAKNGLRVKARVGHHIELLKKLAKFMDDKGVFKVGDKMRRKRNLDLYGGGILMSEKEAKEYNDWLKTVFLKAETYLFGVNKLL